MRSSDGARRGLRAGVAAVAAALTLALVAAPGTAATTPLTASVLTQTRHLAGGDVTTTYRLPGQTSVTTPDGEQLWFPFDSISSTRGILWPPLHGKFTVGHDPAVWASNGYANQTRPSDHVSFGAGLSPLCYTVATSADLVVDQVAYDSGGKLTSFAGRLSFTCASTGDDFVIDIRLANDEPISGFGLLSDPTLPRISTPAVSKPYVENAGTADLALGSFSVTDVPPGWTVTVDAGTCPASLAPVQYCYPDLHVTGDGNPGGFTLHVQTPGGPSPDRTFWMHTAQSVPVPVLQTRSAGDGVHLSWTEPVGPYEAQLWDVYRGDAADGPWTLLTTTRAMTATDTTVAPGATAYYEVTARRTGPGLAAPSTSAVVPGARLAVAPTGDVTDAAAVSTDSMTWTSSTSLFARDLVSFPDGPGTYPSSVLPGGFFATQIDPYAGFCLRPVGTVTVRDLVRSADGSLVRLDASVSGTCHGGAPWQVELRRGEAGGAFGDAALQFYSQGEPLHVWLGAHGDVVLPLRNDGNAPVTLGTPSLSAGGHEAEWSLSSTCAATLAPGAACRLVATWTPAVAGPESVTVHVPGAGLTGSLDLTHHVVADVDADPPYLTGAPVQPLLVDDLPHMQTASFYDTLSGVTSMDVRFRAATATSTSLGSWMYPAVWQGTAWDGNPVQVSTPRPGKTSCVSVRARDAMGNVSGWSPATCSSQVFDDADLTPDRHWSAGSGSIARFDHGTYSVTTTKGATFTGHIVRARHVGVLVTTCATCGSLDVYIGSTLVGRVNTYSWRVHYRVMVVLRVHSTSAYGRLRLVVPSSGSRVIVDGFGATIA